MTTEPIQIRSLPGIKRDGTMLEGDNHVDGRWVRWQRGLPRKMPGYRVVNRYLRDIARTLHSYSYNGLAYTHTGSASRVERFYLDDNSNSSIVSDRTPTTLTVNDNNTWQFDVDTAASLSSMQLLAQVAPNLGCLCNGDGGQLFYGDLFGTDPLVELTVGAGNLPTNVSLTGGVANLHPYAFIFGNSGWIGWSVPGNPTDFVGSGSGNTYITGQKLVRGMPMRGGAGNSPSGLFWSADSLMRASYVGGTQTFQFDTISAQLSILSPQSVIEYDGVFFWAGVDRFMMFNGVVRDVPNDMNINFFFDNLNHEQKQKVFSFKVPRYGEIWWCFPKDDSPEPNHAVIFNTRENVWYDTALPGAGRAAGIFPTVTNRVFLSGVEAVTTGTTTRITEEGDTRITEEGDIRVTEDSAVDEYKLWQHEHALDEQDGSNFRPVQSYFETGEMCLPVEKQINKSLQILMLEPDFVQSGDMTVQIKGRANARAPEVEGPVMTFPDTASTSAEQVVYFSEARRQMRFRFESNVLGGDYQMGVVLAHLQPADGTVIG